MPPIITEIIKYIQTPQGIFDLIKIIGSVVGFTVAIYFRVKPKK